MAHTLAGRKIVVGDVIVMRNYEDVIITSTEGSIAGRLADNPRDSFVWFNTGRHLKDATDNKYDLMHHKGMDETKEDLQRLLDLMDLLSPDGYAEWIGVGKVLYPLGDAGFKMWLEWSSKSQKYVAGICESRWKNFGLLKKQTEKPVEGMQAFDYFYSNYVDSSGYALNEQDKFMSEALKYYFEEFEKYLDTKYKKVIKLT